MQRGLQFVRQFQRAGGGLFGDGHEYGRFATLRGCAQFRGFGTYFHVGDVFQRHRKVVHRFHYRFAEFFHFGGREYSAHDIFIAKFVKYAAIGVQVHVLGDGHHFSHRYAVVAHPFGVQLNLIFLDVSSEHCHLCHASGGEQARADRPVGNRPQIEHGGGVGGQTDDEHFAQDGRLGAESRLAHVDGK